MDVEAELDRLYSLPLDEFTAARNAIAAEAKKSGEDVVAGNVKKLAKPSVAAWTLNQIARRSPEQIEELYSVRASLESAGSAKELRSLTAARREAIAGLTDLARDVLEGSAHGVSHATLEKVSQALLLGGTDEERELLRRGRLTREPTGSDLDAFGLSVASEEEGAAPAARPLKVQREIDRLRREAERLQQEAARLEQEATFAARQAEIAREKADSAFSAAEAAKRTLSEAEAGAEA